MKILFPRSKSMSYVTKKTKQEVEIMAQGGARLAKVLARLRGIAKPGAETAELERRAQEWLKELGAEPAFLNYRAGRSGSPYPCSVCVSLNQEIVHGLSVPSRVLKSGDLVSLDFGAKYKGLYTDMAITFYLGRAPKEVKRLIKITYDSLRRAIRVVRPGNNLSDIGKTIESCVAKHKLGIVRDLVGHGVGYAVHEPPRVPNYDDPTLAKIPLEPGMCLAIEPMLTLGDFKIKTLEDGWTVVTKDGSLSAHAEVTVAVTEKGHRILTPFID
ncbi:type I methionyl aminopeptidase [Patescibacteria group bacterium]|nr:type I methionyl aminopeptidase [Patescibacteria group bacterium]